MGCVRVLTYYMHHSIYSFEAFLSRERAVSTPLLQHKTHTKKRSIGSLAKTRTFNPTPPALVLMYAKPNGCEVASRSNMEVTTPALRQKNKKSVASKTVSRKRRPGVMEPSDQEQFPTGIEQEVLGMPPPCTRRGHQHVYIYITRAHSRLETSSPR